MNYLQRTPFLRLLAPLILGIVLAQFFKNVPTPVFTALAFVAAFLIVISFFIKNIKNQFANRWFFGAGISLLVCVTGFYITSRNDKKAEFNFPTEKSVYEAELVSAPVEKQSSYMLRVKILNINNLNSEKIKNCGDVVLYLQKDSAAATLLYGDVLMFSAQLAPPQPPLNPDAFDYAKYLKRQGIAATAYISTQYWQKIGQKSNFSLYRLADRSRNYLLNIYRDLGLTGNEFAVVAALTLGYTDEISPDLIIGYSASGAVHILSVSGLHVAIIYGFLFYLFGFLFKKFHYKRVIQSVTIIICLWAYALLTGLSAPVIRSAFMFSAIAFALCWNRKSEIYNTIFMSAFFILLVNPNNFFQIGFQLTYAAVLSIVFFSRPANKLLKTNNKLAIWAVDLFIVSISAQLGTAPFTIYYFHQFPTYFLLTNLVAIPLSSAIIYLAICTLALSFVPYLSAVLAFALKYSVAALNGSIMFVYNLPHSIFKISINFTQMWLVVAAIILFCIFYYSKKFFPLAAGLLCILFVLILNIKIKQQTLDSKQLIVYSSARNTHISFVQGDKNTVFTTDSAEIMRLAGQYWDNNKLDYPEFIGENGKFADGFVNFEGKRIFIQTDDFFKRKTAEKPLNIDFLIIGAHQKPQFAQLLTCFSPKEVIVCNGVSRWYSEQIKTVCGENKIPCFSIAENGYFALKIK